MGTKRESKTYTLRLPKELGEAVEAYLEKLSYGESLSEKFLHFFEEIVRLDSEGVSFVNIESIKKAILEKEKQEQKEEFGEIENPLNICVRFPRTFTQISYTPAMRTQMCERCKINMSAEFKACRELRQEAGKIKLGDKTQ